MEIYLRISLSCLSSPLRQSPSFTNCIFCSLSWPTSESSWAILSSFLILEEKIHNCHVWFNKLELGNKLMNDFLEPQKVFPTKNRWKSFQCWSYNLILSKLQLIPTWSIHNLIIYLCYCQLSVWFNTSLLVTGQEVQSKNHEDRWSASLIFQPIALSS